VIGCRVGAKNTLEKNYLWLAERRGTRIEPGRAVVDVRALGAADGSGGYEVEHVSTPPARRTRRRVVRTRGVVVAGGTLGTNDLLLRCRGRGSLPRLSARLGELVRTNSETITAATAFAPDADYTGAVTITASIYPDESTHVTNNSYGLGGDGNAPLFVPMVGDGSRIRRLRALAGALVRHPRLALRAADPVGWSRRTVIFTTMQSADTSLRLTLRARRAGRGLVMDTAHGDGEPPSVFLPVANRDRRAAHGRLRAEHDPRRRARRTVDGALPRRLRDRRLAADRRRRLRAARVRLRAPADRGRLGDAGQPRREPVADDHGARRARDEQAAAGGQRAAGSSQLTPNARRCSRNASGSNALAGASAPLLPACASSSAPWTVVTAVRP
jgi:hypothetical protein